MRSFKYAAIVAGAFASICILPAHAAIIGAPRAIVTDIGSTDTAVTLVRHAVRRAPAVRHHVHHRRPVVVVRPYHRRPYYGRIVAGVAVGAIITAAAAGAAPPPPAPNLCWYWTNTRQTAGYWDYCR